MTVNPTNRRLIYVLLLFVGLFVSCNWITFPSEGTLLAYFKKFLDLLLIILFCECSRLLLQLLDGWLRDRFRASYPKLDVMFPAIVSRILIGIFVVALAIICLQNFTSVNITPVLASLGLGGLAIALAAKDTISNFFGAITVIFDKPFIVGERISISDFKGEVVTIRLRTTILRNEDGALITIPNQKFIDTPIVNLSRKSEGV